ncbi:MAG: hypothetical protein BGO55_11260 [Sphingobacteriales bacterium 50-39]|nr:hypothetical protein [Sphingobacteriales bacterium]OJW54275.1 MAG: hypothetical protein BGO55_11260 [Sphingobacteriales bacterium 50-39]
MLLPRTIQYKALLLLAVFAANFFVVCHCSVRAAGHSACCAENVRKTGLPGNEARFGEEENRPCKDDNGCSGMHAVKFNLLEKQEAKKVSAEPVLAEVIVHMSQQPVQVLHGITFHPDVYSYKHPPPDYQSLYQCFLI